MKKNKFEVGDYVRVIDEGKTYTTWGKLVNALIRDNLSYADYVPFKNTIGEVIEFVFTSTHNRWLYLIKVDDHVYLIAEGGLEKDENSLETFDYRKFGCNKENVKELVSLIIKEIKK